MTVRCPTDLIHGDCFIELTGMARHFNVQLKLEGFSATGSIKLKAAVHMIREMERDGTIRPGSRLIESSSGNLGLALSMTCAARGYRFTCVSDPNISTVTAKLIKAYGADLIIVRDHDSNGGYLGTRISLIKTMLKEDDSLVWINQYQNKYNVDAHKNTTAKEILKHYPSPDFVFIGAGTTGTLGGVSRELRERTPATRIVAIDSVGSVTFGGAPGKRRIPGLGTSSPPPIRELAQFDDLLMIPESATIATCRRLARRGLLLGGSSGTVLAGVASYAARIPADSCVVAISPDLGDRYADTIYSDDWVRTHFPELAEALSTLPASPSEQVLS